jgi:hypothetical protein
MLLILHPTVIMYMTRLMRHATQLPSTATATATAAAVHGHVNHVQHAFRAAAVTSVGKR